MYATANSCAAPLDLLVVGAGPAGLAAVTAATTKDRWSAFAVDLGKPAASRDHERAEDLGVGVGGAGLFSDGKFSFRPSATRLWLLDDHAAVAEAEEWMLGALRRFGLPDKLTSPATQVVAGEDFQQKWYPSYYLSPAQRRAIVDQLANSAFPPRTGMRIDRVQWLPDRKIFQCAATDLAYEKALEWFTRAVVFAGGRIGPVWWRQVFSEAPLVFRRVELGMRIEHNPAVGPLASCDALDVKLVASSHDAEWRTFCSCRQGQVVAIKIGDITAYSGRADCAPTGRSNFGFNLRLSDAGIGEAAWASFLQAERNGLGTAPEPLSQIVSPNSDPRIAAFFGPRAFSLLREGLQLFLKKFPDLHRDDTFVYAPSVEGVGYYPAVDNSLRVADYPLWACGDAAGLFRGNTAALVSGYYAGLMANRYLRENHVP